MSGWIKLHRAIQENDIWVSSKFSPGQAWVDLILRAQYEDGGFSCRGIWIELKRGQLAVASETLARTWKWSRNRVFRFLNGLETKHQIEQQKNNVITVITILNYDKYQQTEQQTEPQTKQQVKQQTEQQTEHIQEYKKERMEEKRECKRLHGIPSAVEEVIEFGKTLNPKKDEQTCRDFWAHYEGQARTNPNGDLFWITSGEQVVTNWKIKLQSFGTYGSKTHQQLNRPNPRNAVIAGDHATTASRYAELVARKNGKQPVQHGMAETQPGLGCGQAGNSNNGNGG